MDKDKFVFTVTDATNETPAVEIASRFNNSRVGPNGFFGHYEFTASFTGTVQVHLGPDKDNLTQIPDLDASITADAGPHTFDVSTRAAYMKLVFNSGSSYEVDVIINR